MSATNRGVIRNEADYYPTPKYIIEEFLGAFLLDERIDRPDKKTWCDPCCGGCDVNDPAYSSFIIDNFNPDVVSAFDIREDSKADDVIDYLSTPCASHDIIISNPPFNLAKEFIEKALSEVNDDGYVIMLLRINFLGSAARVPFFKENMPHSIYVHANRPSFSGKGTDATEYAHFVWKKGNFDYAKLYHLGVSRKEHKLRR